MNSVKWGEYQLDKLFDIKSIVGINSDKLVVGNEFDYVTRTSINQGIYKQTGVILGKQLNEARCWSLGLLQMDFFYREKPWYAGQFVRKVVPKIVIERECVPFFTAILNKQKPKLLSVLVRDVDKTFKNLTVKLPITEIGEIDFVFIKNLIHTIKKSKLNILQEFYKNQNLINYKFTNIDEQAINNYNNIKWQKFTIRDLFNKVKTKSLKIKTSELPKSKDGEYNLPALTAGIQNQGLNNYVKRTNATILKDVISISANGANTGVTFYQSEEFTVLQDAYAIDWIYSNKKPNENQFLFLTAAITKSIYGNFEWTNKAGWEKIKSCKIELPVYNNQIALDFMDKFVSAIKKQVIKKVIESEDLI